MTRITRRHLFMEVQRGCVACHRQVRDRLRTDAW